MSSLDAGSPTSAGTHQSRSDGTSDASGGGCLDVSSVDTSADDFAEPRATGRLEPASVGCPHTTDTCQCDGDALTRAGVPPLPERPWLTWVGEVPPELARRLACDGTI